MIKSLQTIVLIFITFLFIVGCAPLQESSQHKIPEKIKMVVQVNTGDPQLQGKALKNTMNAWKSLKPNVEIEIVTFSKGCTMLTPKSPHKEKVEAMMTLDGITFSACQITKDTMAKKGKNLKFLKGVNMVPSGTVRIVELQQHGYAYFRP